MCQVRSKYFTLVNEKWDALSESLKWISLAFQKTHHAVHQSLVKQSHAHCCYCQPVPHGLAVGGMCYDYNLGTDMVKGVTELGRKAQHALNSCDHLH